VHFGAGIEDDLAVSNVNRSYSLAATSIAILTFMLDLSVSEASGWTRVSSGGENRIYSQEVSR